MIGEAWETLLVFGLGCGLLGVLVGVELEHWLARRRDRSYSLPRNRKRGAP